MISHSNDDPHTRGKAHAAVLGVRCGGVLAHLVTNAGRVPRAPRDGK